MAFLGVPTYAHGSSVYITMISLHCSCCTEAANARHAECFPLLESLETHCVGPSSFVAFAFPSYRVESWGNEALGPMMPSRARYDFLHIAGD